MLAVSEAQALVVQHARPLPAVRGVLGPETLGQVLAEDVVSDLDMPPHDKALMDGYAVRTADLKQGGGSLDVIEEITAGRTPQLPVAAGQASRIMTGAPVPAGADAVVMVERTQALGDRRVQVKETPRPGQNIMPRGSEMRRGETILVAGTVLRPQEIGMLATVGRATVQVIPPPQVAVLATGDELVEVAEQPGPGQIRNGNGPLLLAQVRRAGGVPHYLGIARDTLDSLRDRVSEGLRSPLLVLTGGVSAGKLDLVPGVLGELGVEAHFHKIAMKPGKPVFFGTRGSTLVFGLPGNPVSALVCFELFVRPAIRRLRGLVEPGPLMAQAVLTQDCTHPSDRPTYHPARLELAEQGWTVRPVPWLGSSDLRGLTRANALVLLPAGPGDHKAGQRFAVLRTDD